MTHLPGSLKYRIALAIAFVSLVAILGSQPAPREQVGPLPGGAFLLNSGWRRRPGGQAGAARHAPHVHRPLAGRQVPAGAQRRLPAALGQRDRYRDRPRHRQRPGGRRLARPCDLAQGRPVYVGGGSHASLFEFAFANGVLTPARTFAVVPQAQRGTRISSATWRSRPTAA